MSQEGFDLLKKECINSGLCVVCGACNVVCPNKAIQMKRYSWGLNPELCGSCVEEKCTKCYDVCPAKEVPLSKIERRFFGKAAGEDGKSASMGVVRNVYTGYAQDPVVHGAAVSGGVASAVLVHALESGQIDGAILASYDPEKSWIAKARVATTKEQILSCGGSKYQPHPQLLGLEEACKMGLKKLAITATPCHAVAIRKMMMDEQFSDIGSRIKLLISNICAAHWSLHGTEWLIKEKMGLKLEDVAGIKYRARPFPGDFQVQLRDGSVKVAPFVNSFLSMLGQFTPEECRLCLEKVGYVADIVVGDTWHHPRLCPSLLGKYSDAEVAKDESIARARNGVTAIITRSELGDSFINSAAKAGVIRLFPDTPETAEQFLTEVHLKGKPVANGPVIAARERRGLPIRQYIRD